jgi:hypothetical protein
MSNAREQKQSKEQSKSKSKEQSKQKGRSEKPDQITAEQGEHQHKILHECNTLPIQSHLHRRAGRAQRDLKSTVVDGSDVDRVDVQYLLEQLLRV